MIGHVTSYHPSTSVVVYLWCAIHGFVRVCVCVCPRACVLYVLACVWEGEVCTMILLDTSIPSLPLSLSLSLHQPVRMCCDAHARVYVSEGEKAFEHCICPATHAHA